MKLRTLVSALLALAVAPFARAATPTNPSPANFATVDTHTSTMKAFLAKKSSATSYHPTGMFFKYTTTGTDDRIALGDDYKTNGIVRLSWKGTSGSSTVKIVRLSDGYTTTLTTTGTSVDFLAPEIGRNYKWTVTNGGNSSTWYFYTDGEAPRIIPQSLCQVGNCRDMGGWVTADGKYRVRQGMGYRNDHNADFYDYSLLKPFWTDIAKIRTDMDLRDKLGSGNYYCLWSLDGNDKHYGRSPYGEHWWNVWYWNVLREGDYGAVMNAYASLVSNRTGTSKKAAVKTWKCFANPQYLPIVVHCSQGRDRTGTVAFVLLGALGVGLNDLYADWALTDYAAPKDFPTDTQGEGNGCIVALYTAIKNAYPDTKYSTLQAKCKQLLTDMGVSDAELTNLKSYLLEPVEEKLTADPSSRTKIGVPSLSAAVVAQKSGTVQKPTVKSTSASSTYSVDYGGGGYEAYGKYLVTVNLQNPATTQWSDGTIGPKVLPYIIKHSGNVFQGNVLSFFKGDTNDHIRLAMPRYLGETTCSYTEAQLQKLEPGTYTAKLTAQKCELSPENTNEHSCKFTVYPATEKAAYIYEYADLNQAFFKTDYVPAIKTDKIEVRIKDNCTTEGGGYFSCSPYPACLTMFKLSAGKVRYHQGAQRSDIENFTTTDSTIYKYTVATDDTKRKLTVYDESANKSYSTSVTPDSTTPTPGMAYIGCASDPSANRGAEGAPGYHEPHRLYHVKVWASNSSTTPIHEFVPCKTTSGYAMLYDKVTKKLYPFSHTMGNTGTVTLGGTATKIGDDPEPTVDPTAYGAADTAARTYTWKGFNGPWEYTTNWTASTGATYGIPSHASYATADFPATLTAATACTLTSNRSVLKALFNSPNLTLTIDNATLTVTGLTGDSYYSTYNFGNTATGNPKIIFKGANPRITETKVDYRANFGYAPGGATGNCTVRFEVPAANWSTAPIYTTANESTVCFWSNVRFEIDATALGVPAAGASKPVPLAFAPGGIRFYGVTLDEILARSTISVASGATGTVAVEGTSLVLKLTSGETPVPTPVPEPIPSSKFDADHTIICYGDSLTRGENSETATVDNRANYHDGRLAGLADEFLSYPYWLSGSVTNYNVINQSRSGAQTCNITSWSGEQTITVKRPFELPAVGSVSVATNLVFKDGPYGEWGGWATWEKEQDVFNRWAGFVTPILPLMEKYDEATTRYSITGTLAGRYVRLYGKHPTNITITVFGTGTAQTVAAGAAFVPDNARLTPYKDAIRVICAGANDGCKNYATAIKPLLVKFRDTGTKYVVMSPWNNTDTGTESNSQTTPTAMEADMAKEFGDHYINMRRMLMTNGLATAVAIGQMTAAEAKATTWNTKGAGLMSSDGVHFNKKGNAVIAEFVRQKLVALGYVTGDTPTPTPEPTPEPQPTSPFDAAHTIVCFGDSLTWGASAAEVAMDSRANYHDGRLAGVAEVPQSYPYWLSSLVPSAYNVINQSRSGSQTCNITSWTGEQRVDVKRAFELPAVGSVSVATNFVFNNGPWGEWGGWAGTGTDPVDTFNRWAGFVTPIFPLMEKYDAAKTRYSVTGTLAGRHVRLAGVYPTNITVTVFGEGTAQPVAAGTPFIPDMATSDFYTNAIRVVCAGGNDGEAKYATHIKPLLQAFAKKGGKYLILTSCATTTSATGTTPSAMEADMAQEFGANFLNLRLEMETNATATATALDVPFTGKWSATDGTGLKALKDSVHFSEKGYKVMAEFVRRKLVALGYVEETPTPVVDPTKYGAADTKATTYDWKGFSGPWNFTTNWTPSATPCYGIPNNKTYATANFPSNVANAFVCTVTNNMTVKYAKFDSPDMQLVLDNASLTVTDALSGYPQASAYCFGHSQVGNPVLTLSGAKAALIGSLSGWRSNIGCLLGGATGSCTVRFVVPASGWTTAATAPLRATATDAKVCFWSNVKFDIDATALGVPAAGETKRVMLASSTDGIRFYGDSDLATTLARSTIVAAAGAKAEVSLSTDEGTKYLYLTVSPDTEPTELALLTPADGAADVAVVRDRQKAFFANDRDARWAQVDDAEARLAMVQTSSFPQDVAFTWQGGTAPYTFTLKRTRDSVVVKTATVSTGSISVCNLETGRAYTWTVTDDAGATLSRTFTTAYADQRFLRVAASNAYETVTGYATKTSADVHNGYLPNFRDFGGMFTADGTKRVKQGVVYRSFCFDRSAADAYTSLGVDLETVTNAFGIKTDLDLRTADEVKNVVAHGASPLGANVAWVHCPTLAYDVDNISSNDEQALRVFMDASKLPVVFHCLAGQDRTGTLAMQLGAILDLDEEDIEKGWSASCFFQYGMDVPYPGWVDEGFQTHRVKRFFGDYAKYGKPGDTFAACVRNAIKAKTTLTDADFAVIRANLLEADTEVVRPVKATVDVPNPNAVEREYDGTAQTTYLRTNPRYTVAMADNAVLPGDYPVTLTLVDPNVCKWSDGKTEAKTVTFTITGEGPSVVSPEPVWSGTTVTFTNNTQYTFIGSKSYDGVTKAVFEPKAKIVATNGATVTIPKVYLQGAGNAFVTEGEGNKIALTPYQAATLAANTSLTFTANGGTITADKTAANKNWEFNQAGMTLNCTASDGAYLGLSGVGFSKGVIHAALVDATLKFDSFTCATAGSTVALTNATLKTSWNVQMGVAQASLTLAGAAPRLQSAGGPLYLGAKLSVTLAPEPGWSATDGRIHSMAGSSATGAKVTLASGVDFTVDVSAFNGLTTTNTFCLISKDPSATTTHAVTLPDADHVHVVGAGAENCTVTFTKSNDNFVYVTVASVAAGGAIVVDPTTGEQKTVDYDKVGETAKAGNEVVIPQGNEVELTQDSTTGAWTLKVGDKSSTFPAYYDVTENKSYVGGTQYDVAITADAERNGSVIAAKDDTPAIQITAGQFAVNLPNAKEGLYYGLEYADNVQFNDSKISWTKDGSLVTAPAGDAGKFYRVVIDDKSHAE